MRAPSFGCRMTRCRFIQSRSLALQADRIGQHKSGLVFAISPGPLKRFSKNGRESWLKSDAPLAGGYGTNIVAWRGTNPVTLFRDHKQMVRSLAESTAIRSNGPAWCTADDNLCVGNDIERTRCSDCSNAVIGLKHAQRYRGLHHHLRTSLKWQRLKQYERLLIGRGMTPRASAKERSEG